MSVVCHAFHSDVNSLVCGNSDIGGALKDLLDMARVLRSECAGGSGVLQLFIDHEVPSAIVELCNWFNSSNALKESPSSADLLATKKTLVLVLCQVLANFTASGEIARHHLVSLTFDSLSHVLSAAVITENRKSVAAFLAAVYNCLQTSDDADPAHHTPAQERRLAFASHRGFLCQALLAVLDNSKNNLTGAKDAAPAEDPALEWFHMLANVWVKHNTISCIYQTVGPTTATVDVECGDIVHITHEQVIVLELASSVMEDTYFTQALFPSVKTATDAISPSTLDFHSILAERGSGGLLDFLLQIVITLVGVNVDVVFSAAYSSFEQPSPSSGDIDAAVNAVEIRMRRGLTIDFLPLSLQLLASTLAVLPAESGRRMREVLATETTLLDTLVRILRGRDVSARARDAQLSGSGAFANLPPLSTSGESSGSTKTCGVAVAPSSAQEPTSDLLKECIRLSLQLLGNLVYGCDIAKDALRESGALAAVLSHCATDFHNPISREWALLCVRNACDNHLGNQTFIQELRPQEVVIQDEKLKEQGLRVEMNTETGQFKFVDVNK